MNGLILPDQGEVYLFGKPLSQLSEAERTELRKRCTMVFQLCLIDSMTVGDNIAFPLLQNTNMSRDEIDKLVFDLLDLLDCLPLHTYYLVVCPEVKSEWLWLEQSSRTQNWYYLMSLPIAYPLMTEFVDSLITKTQKNYGITSVMISHDMASNRRLADQMAVLVDGELLIWRLRTYPK